MKTAISLPDALFDEADAVAYRLGVSRSQLYATALAEYIAKFREADVTAKLDAVYGDGRAAPDAAVTAAAIRTARVGEW